MKNFYTVGVLSFLTSIALAGDGDTTSPAANKPSATHEFRAVASVQEIMLAEINPSATYIWDSVSSESSAKGSLNHRPTSNADWLAARHQALVLVEAGNLLLLDRPVVTRGGKVKDAELPGIQDAKAIRKAMDGDREKLAHLVHGLQDAGAKVLTAIDRKDVDGLSDAGGEIDEACEACHKAYWYPDPLQAPKR